ncbi:uncharacterized protein B0H18DRAFT_962690 [Fomitopsis serialis]|uniref:uncharacterized protein n=1 Tax=Fomitopsis serialis TaxID=139415 RepID=UPI0020086DFB|nr:uncharacterized protein B0H18DRAFT_962690 [Neoantrodia serialis]KAH9910915.1 hypothetical protein B0H18DRAFT_962690 [Neoantrodia serialis]
MSGQRAELAVVQRSVIHGNTTWCSMPPSVQAPAPGHTTRIPPSVAHQYDERMPGLTSPSNQANAYGPSKHAPPQQARTGAYGYGRCVRVRPSVAHQYYEHMPGLTSPSKHAPPQQARTGAYGFGRCVRVRPMRTDTTDGYGYHHPSHTNTMPGLTSPSKHAPPQQPRTDTTDGYGYHHPSHTNTMPGLTSPSKHAPPQQPRTGAYGYGRCVRVRPSVAHQYYEHMPGLTSPSKHAPPQQARTGAYGFGRCVRVRPMRTDTTDGYGYHHPSHTNTMPGLTSPSKHAPPQQPRTDTTDGYGYHHPSHTNTMPGLTSPSKHAPIRPTGTGTTIRRTPIRRAHAGLDQPQQARTGAYGFGRCVRVRPSVAHQYDEHMPGLTSPSKHAPPQQARTAPASTHRCVRIRPMRAGTADADRYDRRVRIPPSVAHQYGERMSGLTSPSKHAPQYGERMSGLTSPNKQDHSCSIRLVEDRIRSPGGRVGQDAPLRSRGYVVMNLSHVGISASNLCSDISTVPIDRGELVFKLYEPVRSVYVKFHGMPDSKRVTRSVATEQGSETPRSTRLTNTQAAGGSMKNSKFTKGKAKEVAAKKKGQEREKEKEKERRTTQVRKRASKIMAEEELLSDEEQPKTKKKKRAVVEDEAEADEQDKAVEDTPEDVEMEDDTTSKQPTTTRPKPKPAYGKFARPETSLDPAEENVAQTLIGGRREARENAGSSRKGGVLKPTKPKSGGGKSTHGTAKPKALPDKGKARATGKDDSVESEHDPKSDEDSDGGGSDDAYDDDAGDDGSQVEDEDDVDDVGPESQESEDGDDEGEDEGDVVVVSETRAQSKPALAKSTGSGRDSSSRARVADLPAKVRTLVSAAQNCLRLRIALNSAWTKEASVASKRLPRRDILIRDSVRDAYDRRGTGNHAADIKAAFWLLADKKDDKKKDKKEADHTQKDKKKANGDASSDGDEDSERAALRAKAYSVTRNELKRKAKQVIEQTFKLGSLTVPQRTEVVVWLLETHPTEVNDGSGTRNIANFVFGGVEFHFDRKKKLDRELTKVEPTEPFRNECIPELIYQYYGLAGRGDANINAALDEFSKMPFNLIALACNAIEAALMEVTSHNQSIFFSGKLFAAKWDGTMAILETLEDSASEYLEETRELIWKHISNRLNAGPNALEGVTDSDEQPGSFIPLLQLRASKAQSSSDKPGTSKAATKPPSSTAKKGNKSTASSKTAGKPSGSSKSAKTPNSSQAAKNPPSPSRKTRGAGASTSKSQNHQRRDSDGSEGGEAGGQGHSEDEGGAGLSGEGGEGVQTEIDELRGSGEDRGSGASTNGGA